MDAVLNIDFEDLVRENLAPLRGYIASLGTHGDLVDDLAQDVFVEAAKHFDRYDPDRPFRSWLFGIARNMVHQEFRKKNVESRVRKGFATEVLINTETSPSEEEAQWASQRALAALRACIEGLSERMRRLVDLRFQQRESTDAIAQILKMKGSAVRMALLRVRRSLFDCVTSGLHGADN